MAAIEIKRSDVKNRNTEGRILDLEVKPQPGRQSHPLFKWCFTENDEKKFPYWINDPLRNTCKEYRWQFEKGADTGKLHIQGCFWLLAKQRLSWLRNNFSDTCHYEPARNWAASWAYCGKPDTKYSFEQDGKLIFGLMQEAKHSVKPSILTLIEESKTTSLEELAEDDEKAAIMVRHSNGLPKIIAWRQKPRNWEMEVTVLEGPPGCGKTRFIYDTYDIDQVFNWGWESKFFNGYQNEPVLLIDDFDGHGITLPFLLKLLDRYPMRIEIKGGYAQFNSHHIFITTNYPFDEWYRGNNNRDALKRRLCWLRFDGKGFKRIEL